MQALAVSIFLLGSLPAASIAQQSQDNQQSAPEIKFRADINFLKLPPDLYLGEASGVAVNSKGHIFVLSRGNSHRSGIRRDRRAASGVRRQWEISARDRPQSIRVGFCACGEGRQAGQHLGYR